MNEDDNSSNSSCCKVLCSEPDKRSNCLPEPKRPLNPVDYSQHELLECFPCYYEATWPLMKFPFLKWLLQYNLSWLISDIVAGLTVGLMVVPQALAYARIATLPPNYGLYSAFMGCFIYVLFGTSKDITLGPTAILSLLTASITENCGPNEDQYDERITCALALTFFSGAIQFALGILNLGFLVDFIPLPVISGFTSAAAITIAVGQLKHLLGLNDIRRDFMYAVYDNCAHIKETKVGDLVLGCLCMLIVLLMKYLKGHTERLQEKRKDNLHFVQKLAFKFIWLLCTARNAVVVFVAALVGYSLTLQPWFTDQITLIDYHNGKLPPIRVPNPSSATCSNLGIGILVAPLISFLESIAIAKAFARKNGYKVEPSQELVAIGMCNLASSFVGSYPVTGSFSRTAVNAQSGVKTPAAGIVTGSVVLLALAVLSAGFHYIPSASLAAIIIVAVLPVVDIIIVWKIILLRWIDVVPLVVSFVLTLFMGIEYGVPLAVVVYILLLLYRHARPRHEVKLIGNTVCMVFNGGWTYPGVNYILKRVNTEVTSRDTDPERSQTKAVVFDCTAMPDIDFTIVHEVKEVCEELEKKQIKVFVIHAQDHVRKLLEKASISNLTFQNSMQSVDSIVAGSTTSLIEDETTPLRGQSYNSYTNPHQSIQAT